MDKVVVQKFWFTDIENLSVENQDKVIAEVMRSELGMERKYRDDIVIAALVDYIRRNK